MILENIKKINVTKDPLIIFQTLLALVFLSAGIFRIFNPEIVLDEATTLRMPVFLFKLVIVFEIVSGIGLLFNRGVKYIYTFLILFLSFALVLAIVLDGGQLLKSASELFVFNLTPTDWLLHFVFLLVALVLLIKNMTRLNVKRDAKNPPGI